MLLQDRVAVISGAATENGIGLATARLFAERGASVAILDLERQNPAQAALVVNAIETEMICGVAVTSLPVAAEAAVLLSKQVANVVVTAGGLGLAVAEGKSSPYVEAAHSVKLVDTHGAGDAFIGALAARWASGTPLREAVRFANAAAALFVSTPADRKKAVTLEQVTRFLSGCR